MRLDGKVVIITGAGSGMGRAMAEVFAAEGAKVLAGEWNEETLKETCDIVRGAGGEIKGVQGNIAKPEECEKIVAAAVEAFGKLDVLVNNAGVMDNNHPIGTVDDATLERVLGINLYGTMYMTRAAIPRLEANGGGAIVNVASVAGLKGGVAGVAYTVSKHGILGLTKNTAWMYGPKGIRCNAICPGAVATNIQASMDMTKVDPFGSERLGLVYQLIPGTLQPADIASLALFLASDEASKISGACIPADAGWASA
jgi:NAD(P)-dependent dehydrogenase (short-subunit alcohol dehydrogenase family)